MIVALPESVYLFLLTFVGAALWWGSSRSLKQ